jgi:tetratricopeptide (TPR) repeat protein
MTEPTTSSEATSPDSASAEDKSPNTPFPDLPPEELRQAARHAYTAGALDEALARQQALLAADVDLVPGDFVFLGLVQHAAGRIEDSIAALRDAEQRFPEAAEIHENLGVVLLLSQQPAAAIEAAERALALGSESPNVLDCLCDAANRIGRTDLAVQYGRQALEAKDAMFRTRTKLAEIPPGLPPPFDPTHKADNIIAYCLWGEDQAYQLPLLESARIVAHLFPGWTMRVYHDASVPPAFRTELSRQGVQLRLKALPAGVPQHRRRLWRFDVLADPTVRRFLIRDADALLSVKERVAVDAWLASSYWFHAMRDWYTHTDVLLAGMWGGVGNVLPGPEGLLRAYTGWRMENDHLDQDVLSETVWPTIRSSCLIHDSIFTGCLGSVPFPPFGTLMPGHHVGQNALV